MRTADIWAKLVQPHGQTKCCVTANREGQGTGPNVAHHLPAWLMGHLVVPALGSVRCVREIVCVCEREKRVRESVFSRKREKGQINWRSRWGASLTRFSSSSHPSTFSWRPCENTDTVVSAAGMSTENSGASLCRISVGGHVVPGFRSVCVGTLVRMPAGGSQ